MEKDPTETGLDLEGNKSSDDEIMLVGVKFRPAEKTHYFQVEDTNTKMGDLVIVETESGLGMARVVTPISRVSKADAPPDLKRVVRQANRADLERHAKNKEKAREAFKLCLEKIKAHKLNMKLIQVEYLHDGSKAIFFYTAEQRVDFRELVKDLAKELHIRIEMRQIGVRDEAKLCGGIGNCGQVICCNRFLTEFKPVSVRMAKDQNLAMNPAKVSGVCGRLMCCLAFEYPFYQECLAELPFLGKTVMTPRGQGKVVELDFFNKQAVVQLEDNIKMKFSAGELKVVSDAVSEEPKELEIEEELKRLEE